MQPQTQDNYKQLLTEVIKKQIVILGPDITLSKARNVPGLKVSDDGTVTEVGGSPQEVTQALIDQFVQLSGLIVKKTMEPLLSISQVSPNPTVIPAQAGIQETSGSSRPASGMTNAPEAPIQQIVQTPAPVQAQAPSTPNVILGNEVTPESNNLSDPGQVLRQAQDKYDSEQSRTARMTNSESPIQAAPAPVAAPTQPPQQVAEQPPQPAPQSLVASNGPTQGEPAATGSQTQLEPAKNPLAA
jgi:hypothetical protein